MDLELLEEKMDSITDNVKWLALFARESPKTLDTFKYINQAKESILNKIDEIIEMAK